MRLSTLAINLLIVLFFSSLSACAIADFASFTLSFSLVYCNCSIENDRVKDEKSALSQAERDEKNKTINKFIANVESRIYANLSKQLVDNMFGTSCTSNCATSGTAEVEGSQIYWVKDSSTDVITLTITDTTGTVSTMSVPVGDFIF